MRFGNAVVEQVDSSGDIVLGKDTSLSNSELLKIVKQYFPNITVSADGLIIGNYEDKKYTIRVKNVTYLGNPHPIFKKRIQISNDLRDFYMKSNAIGAQPILLGVYCGCDNTLFVDFSIDTFVGKSAHNSSAHVYTSDLSEATIHGFFQKVDFFSNTITCFRPDLVNVFLEDLLVDSKAVDSKVSIKQEVGKSQRLFPQEIENNLKTFFAGVGKEWQGISCYTKMIDANYRNKFQPEWVGFFLEFEFEKFIKENNLESLVRFAQDKSENGIDLDLFFPGIGAYGDLKAHSDSSGGIQGNDWNTVFAILDSNTLANHIFYIVCEHTTVKDSACNYEVTQFWNNVQNKSNPLSYAKRMKNKVTLKRWLLLDINPSNVEYLTMFKQGINSNGKPRPPKIMIDHNNLDKFIIAEYKIK